MIGLPTVKHEIGKMTWLMAISIIKIVVCLLIYCRVIKDKEVYPVFLFILVNILFMVFFVTLYTFHNVH